MEREGFFTGLQQSAPLTRATEGRNSPCWGGGGFIDVKAAFDAAALQAQGFRVWRL